MKLSRENLDGIVDRARNRESTCDEWALLHEVYRLRKKVNRLRVSRDNATSMRNTYDANWRDAKTEAEALRNENQRLRAAIEKQREDLKAYLRVAAIPVAPDPSDGSVRVTLGLTPSAEVSTIEKGLAAELSRLATKLSMASPSSTVPYGGWSPGEWARWMKLWANGQAVLTSMHKEVPMRDEIISLIERIRSLKS